MSLVFISIIYDTVKVLITFKHISPIAERARARAEFSFVGRAGFWILLES